jgi:hypothetical protein
VPAIAAGTITKFLLYDVAEAIDLAASAGNCCRRTISS